MELIDQHTKAIMEECKVRARDAGLSFDNESLEYIVTNRDLLELSPKGMIPTLYDYWVDDIEVIKGVERYKLYPNNPYETVINTRPAISFYNDNNPDWLNIMIFYHVLAHIDFFQNNALFANTWNVDFSGEALADKRYIAGLRSEHGRWVDYIIEFSRGIDNLTGYFEGLAKRDLPQEIVPPSKLDFYFDIFLQEIEKIPHHEVFKEVERYNELLKQEIDDPEREFFTSVKDKHPEFNALYKRHIEKSAESPQDLMEYIRDNSPFLKKEDNAWMKSVINIVRSTSLYFSPQIRTKILNEGWASYWHDVLFRNDERIKGHESAYAHTNAMVTSINRIGLNPYAIGLRLVRYVEELANKGKFDFNYQKIKNFDKRKEFNVETGKGREAIFKLRKNFSDFMLINTFVDQDFVDHHKLFVAGRRLNQEKRTYEYYVKSRDSKDYKQMLLDALYHPPKIDVVEDNTGDNILYLSHRFEGKELFKQYISDTMMGIEYLWGGKVQLETTEILRRKPQSEDKPMIIEHRRVLYTMDKRKLFRKFL
jgi:stage V sporulation protein R